MISGAELAPGPDHPITIEPNPRRVVVKLGDLVVADTRRALTLREADYPPVQYIPAGDVDETLLTNSERRTHCPYKGDCGYFGIRGADGIVDDAVWTYPEPYGAVAAIRDHRAFYPNLVDIAEQD